jgi:hypothetical protein
MLDFFFSYRASQHQSVDSYYRMKCWAQGKRSHRRITTPNAHIPDGPEPSGITVRPSGIRIPDASRQESAVRNKASGKVAHSWRCMSELLFATTTPNKTGEPHKQTFLMVRGVRKPRQEWGYSNVAEAFPIAKNSFQKYKSLQQDIYGLWLQQNITFEIRFTKSHNNPYWQLLYP